MDLHTSALSGDSAGDWIERLARAGYITKGIVYGLIGVLAVQAAFSAGGSTEGTRGAIGEIASGPFGTVLLAAIAVGLLGYATWRFVSAILDPNDAGTDAKGIVKRIGYLISGLTYLGLAFWAASVVVGFGSSGSGGGDAQQEWTARLMSQPLGPWLVGAVGVIIIGVGLYHFVRAVTAKFMRHYERADLDTRQRRWAKRLGQFGLSARGVTFSIIGIFLIQAAIQSDPSETRGLSGALQTLSEQPYGPWLLGVVALGLVAYGLYAISRGWYSRFSVQ